MIKEQIQECIQRILDNELGGISTNNCPRGGIEKYRYMTAYRLSKYVNFYRTHRISLDDLLISLRNYLLVFQTAVRLPIDIDITDNKYGLRIDSEGLCYATLNLPEYLNVDIIKQGFMEDYIEPKKDERYFLGVTPNIYRLTGFQRFKSIRQKLAVNGALNMPEGYTALVSLPTGGGKSLITQTMAYQKKDGLTITVVPTVSLAMDQVRVAKDSICHKGDVVVSQDYGVAAMALGKEAYAIHQSGKWYTNENIDQMLMERHLNKKARRSSHKNHMKGPRKRTEEDDVRFAQSFEKLIQMAKSKEGAQSGTI